MFAPAQRRGIFKTITNLNKYMNTENQHVVVFEIDKTHTQKWKKWCKLLSTTYRSEVEKSLIEEKAEREMFILFELKGKTYGIAYMEGECLPSNPSREVNKIHNKKVRDCLRRISQANVLYNIKINPEAMYSKGGW